MIAYGEFGKIIGRINKMMKFELQPEPEYFDEKVRKKGNEWLNKNPDVTDTNKYPDHWKFCKEDLAKEFNYLCAYSIIRIRSVDIDTVDHYLSKDNYREQTYEWRNYRYANPKINSRKRKHDNKILDPFEVEDDWFEIQLPDCQLIWTDNLPEDKKEKAELTIKKLKLNNAPDFLNYRQELYYEYIDGDISLNKLKREAPLIARAIIKEIYFKGLNFLQNRDYQKAIDQFTETIELDQEYIDAYFQRAICYYYLGEYNQAIEDYTKVIENQNNNITTYNNRGVCYFYNNQEQEAIKDFQTTIKFKQNNYLFYANLSICLEKMGYIKQAILNLKQAINLAQKNNKLDECNYFYDKIKKLEKL